ncbi:hypothetical protein MASR2M70_13320 [Bacillota bacterium]
MGKEKTILYHSNKLFLSQGYIEATMRQIAEAADVSLGLATYHYKTKRLIAVTVLVKYLNYLKGILAKELPPGSDPMVRSAAMIHLCNTFFMAEPRRNFFLQCLEKDIYMESIKSLGNEAMSEIAAAHHLNVSSDLLLLFDNYIPPAVERILILEKEKGGFPNISYEDIPDIVFSITVERYVDKELIKKAAAEGSVTARSLLCQIPQDIDEILFNETCM